MVLRMVIVAIAMLAIGGDPLAAQSSRKDSGEWGAIGYAADGTYAGAWKMPTLAMAHRKVTSECAAFERGSCEVVTFPAHYCAALATYIGPDEDKRNRTSRYGIDRTPEAAQRLAITACSVAASADRQHCEVKGTVCGDGRPARAQPAPSGRSDEPQFRGEHDTPPRRDSGTGNPGYFGAIAFTADGSWATAWQKPSPAEAEADVAKRCAAFGRGSCKVFAFPGEQCVGLATFIGRSGRTRWQLSFTGGGTSGPEAQRTAMDRCNSDNRTRGQCQLRTMVCGDGR
jgi:Domain of unknown function (DUF4189)